VLTVHQLIYNFVCSLEVCRKIKRNVSRRFDYILDSVGTFSIRQEVSRNYVSK
jgi:hypothetical protein